MMTWEIIDKTVLLHLFKHAILNTVSTHEALNDTKNVVT